MSEDTNVLKGFEIKDRFGFVNYHLQKDWKEADLLKVQANGYSVTEVELLQCDCLRLYPLNSDCLMCEKLRDEEYQDRCSDNSYYDTDYEDYAEDDDYTEEFDE